MHLFVLFLLLFQHILFCSNNNYVSNKSRKIVYKKMRCIQKIHSFATCCNLHLKFETHQNSFITDSESRITFIKLLKGALYSEEARKHFYICQGDSIGQLATIYMKFYHPGFTGPENFFWALAISKTIQDTKQIQ